MTSHKKEGHIKPDELKDVACEIRTDNFSDDEVMVLELEERAEVENSDNDVDM